MTTDTFGYSSRQLKARGKPASQWRSALQAGAIVWGIYTLAAVANLLTLGLSSPFTFGLQLVLSGLAGVLAGWLYDRHPERPGHYGKLGVVAGVAASLFCTLTVIVLSLIAIPLTLSVSSFSGLLACLCLPVNLHFSGGTGYLFGKLYERLWSKGRRLS